MPVFMPAHEEILHIAGGDGALFHAINAPDYRGQAVALSPRGRGNALARDLRRLAEPDGFTAIDLIETRITPARGGEFVRLCASSVAFGYPSQVTLKAERLRFLRRLSYAAAGLLTVPCPIGVEIGYDGARPAARQLRGILVNNTRHVGGFTAIREALVDDGLADVLELDAGYLSQTLHNLSEVTGLGLWRPARHVQFRTAEIRTAEPSLLMLDGELVEDVVVVSLAVRPISLRIRIA
jgi:diacylglycerol kinase family enzyme